MRLKPTGLALLLLQFGSTILLAQAGEQVGVPEPIEFGEISDSLFIEEPGHSHPFEYLNRQIRIGFRESGGRIEAVLEHHYRVRVESDDPVQQAEASLVTIPYHHLDGVERIEDVEGVTYHPDGRRFFLEEDEMTTADLDSRYRTVEFLLPNVVQGSILEYRYTIGRRYIEELPDIFLSQKVPTRLFHLILHNEPFLRYRAVESGDPFVLEYHEERIDTSRVPLVFSYDRPEPISVEHWFGELPAVGDPVYSPPARDLRGVLRFQISEFGFPRQPLENSWEFVAAQIRRGDLNPFEYLDHLEGVRTVGKELTQSTSDGMEAVQILYQYLNRRMVYNGELQPFPVASPGQVLNGEPSDQAAINLVMLALLQGAGLDARPVYLSGREGREIQRNFPSLHQFQQMVVLANVDGEQIWMDASYAYSRPGLIRVDSYHREGLLLRRESFEWVPVEPEHSRFELDVELQGTLTRQGDLSGTVEIQSDGYPAREVWQKLSEQESAEDIFRDLFFETYESIRFSDTVIQEKGPAGYPLELRAEFQIPGFALSFQDGLQFYPMIVGMMQENPLPDEEREVPLLLDAPEHLSLVYNLTLPEGFRLQEQSQSGRTGLEGAVLGEFYRVSGRTVSYRFDVDIDRREYSPDEYSELRELYERWVLLSTNEWLITQEEN